MPQAVEIPTVLKRQERGVDIREDLCPAGWVEVDVYHPSSSVTPWDYHGMKHQQEYRRVLESAGLTPLLLQTRKTLIHPVGTGQGGAVRFGDNMMPGVYRIAVPEDQQGKATEAIAEHKAAIDEWIHNGGPMPDACR